MVPKPESDAPQSDAHDRPASLMSDIVSDSQLGSGKGQEPAATGPLNTPSVAASPTVSSESSQNRVVRTQTDSGALSNDQVVAANRASGDDLEPDPANVAEEDSLNLSASSGVLASLLDERETEDSLMAVSFCPSQVDGSFPRFPLVSFLPVTDADAEFDHRLPLVSMSLPRKISHVQGSSQEYFVVEYLESQICIRMDGHVGISITAVILPQSRKVALNMMN